MAEVKSLNPALGAEIVGVDLSQPLDDETRQLVTDAFHDHVVLLFRHQDLDAAAHMRFTEYFGEVKPHPLRTRRNVDGYPGVLILENQPGKRGARNDYWHSDISHSKEPPLGSILHARIVPEGRGDTMFCNMYTAWESLSEGMRTSLENLKAYHSGAPTQARAQEENTDALEIPDVLPPRLHPIARTHPATGRKALFINPHFTTHIEDMTEEESKPILDFLYEHATRHENIYRHRWQVGDVLMWDNRAAMHYAVRDYTEDDRRLMYRTTAAGDVPR